MALKVAFLTTDAREHYRQYDRPDPYFGTAPQALLEGLALLPEVEVHVISCIRRQMRSPAKLAGNVWYHPVLVPKIGWLSTAYLGCIAAIRRKLRQLQPDIVHGQGTERDCAITAVFSGYPNVLTIHGNMRLIARINRSRMFSWGWLAAKLEGLTVPRTHGVVCITEYTRAAVLHEVPRTWVVPNAVATRFFDLPRQTGQPAQNPQTPQNPSLPTILCIGHIQPRKNQNAFIRALDPLAERRQFRVRFLGGLVPGDSFGEEFRALVEARSWCEFGGLIDNLALGSELSQATALALPSVEDNCPMTVLESMAGGIPVLAANVGGVPELITPNETGLLFDPREAESMRLAVASILDAPQLALERAAAAKAEALRRFHPIAVARRHLEIYREVLAEPD